MGAGHKRREKKIRMGEVPRVTLRILVERRKCGTSCSLGVTGAAKVITWRVDPNTPNRAYTLRN